jgi:RNA polymerase primary sigma factor
VTSFCCLLYHCKEGIAITSELALETYLKDINKIKLLSAEEERKLAEKIREGDMLAREKMIKANLRLVVNLAKRYANFGLPLQDLIEEGNIGLLKAVERFDPDKNCRFSTYAAWWIKQSIRRALTDHSKMIRIPSYMREVLNRAEEITENLTTEKGVPPTIQEVASYMEDKPYQQMRTENILKLSSNLSHIQSLDKICAQRDLIEDPSYHQEEINTEDIERLEILLQSLSPKRKAIIRMRFGLDGERPLTLQEISERVKLSRERVRQIIKESLTKLREIIQQGSTS